MNGIILGVVVMIETLVGGVCVCVCVCVCVGLQSGLNRKIPRPQSSTTWLIYVVCNPCWKLA